MRRTAPLPARRPASLSSTEAGHLAGVSHFIDQRCLILPDGWVVPFMPSSTGLLVQVVYSPSDQPPSMAAFPRFARNPLAPHHLLASVSGSQALSVDACGSQSHFAFLYILEMSVTVE